MALGDCASFCEVYKVGAQPKRDAQLVCLNNDCVTAELRGCCSTPLSTFQVTRAFGSYLGNGDQ